MRARNPQTTLSFELDMRDLEPGDVIDLRQRHLSGYDTSMCLWNVACHEKTSWPGTRRLGFLWLGCWSPKKGQAVWSIWVDDCTVKTTWRLVVDARG